MSEVVDLRGVTLGARKRWWLVLLLVFLGGAAGYGWSRSTEPSYQATTSILVGQSLQAPDLSKQDLEASQQLAQTYADLVQRQPVLSGAVTALGLDASWQTLRDRVQVDRAPDNGTLIVVTVEAGSSDEAVRLAGAIADQLIALSPSATRRSADAEIQEFVASRLATLETDIELAQGRIDTLEGELALARTDRRQEELRLEIEGQQRLLISWLGNYSSLLGFLSPEPSPNSLQVLEEATANAEPVGPDAVLDSAVGAAAGLLLALAIIYVLESRRVDGLAGFDPAIRSVARTHRQRENTSGEGDPEDPVILPDAASDWANHRSVDERLTDQFAYGPEGRHRRRQVG